MIVGACVGFWDDDWMIVGVTHVRVSAHVREISRFNTLDDDPCNKGIRCIASLNFTQL